MRIRSKLQFLGQGSTLHRFLLAEMEVTSWPSIKAAVLETLEKCWEDVILSRRTLQDRVLMIFLLIRIFPQMENMPLPRALIVFLAVSGILSKEEMWLWIDILLDQETINYQVTLGIIYPRQLLLKKIKFLLKVILWSDFLREIIYW
jgi:hypothetical protein